MSRCSGGSALSRATNSAWRQWRSRLCCARARISAPRALSASVCTVSAAVSAARWIDARRA